MVFSSITFLFVFLPVVLAVYYLLDWRFKNAFLLLASLLFYYWGEPRFVFVMLASIVWNYLCGLACGFISKEKRFLRRLALVLAVAVNIGLLGYFKYADFAIATVNSVLSRDIPLLNVALPIGISFFTFQGLSYVIDVYRGTVGPQRDPLKLGMYISLFPQLIAGPIVRYSDIEQEISHRTVGREKFYEGVVRFVTGLSKKVILANTLALRADQIFGQPVGSLTTGVAWLGALLYSLQIYFDFSGYSDMAIGLGKMFGFTFLENFNLPYMARSVTEFWRRWHISLSSWFRDYVYIPLGGNRRGNVYLHLLVVFILTGLWHGAAWNFVLWGLWHGLFLIIERVLRGRVRGNKFLSAAGGVYTLLIVMLGWVLFRADTLAYGWGFIKAMFGLTGGEPARFGAAYYLDNFTVSVLVLAVIFSTDICKRFRTRILQNGYVQAATPILEGAVLIGLMFVCAVMAMTSAYDPFIYFRF